MLTDAQAAALAKRFKWFDAAASAALFSAEQEGGQFDVKGQGSFPGIRMANGATWFYDREKRPRRFNTEGKDLGPMKTRAPFGERRLCCTDRNAKELVLVEGEGHATALASLGFPGGIVACGGVSVFESRAAWAEEELRALCTGKRVRILFDPDPPGIKAAAKVAARLLEIGATAVAVLPPQEDWAQGADVEDWLSSFASPQAAYLELTRRLGSLAWVDGADTAKAKKDEDALEEIHVRTARVTMPDASEALLVSVWDEEAKKLSLAVLGPPGEAPAEAAAAKESVRHDAAPEDEPVAGWQLVDSWTHEGKRYVPDEGGAMLDSIRSRSLILPAPPSPTYGTSEELWGDVSKFIGTWLALSNPRQYDVLTAYVLMTYRLFDAAFPITAYLRFHGPPGSGKGRALAVMKSICCWSVDGQPSSENLHRVVEYYGEVSLFVDEFHLNEKSETAQRVIDTLNLGNDAQKRKLRCDTEDGRMVVNAFKLFGPKIFAGYGHDEHEALARRSVSVNMMGVNVPDDIALFALPERFYSQAYALRRRLMAWRGSKRQLGMPDPEGPRARKLRERAGREVGQIFWPLVEMVPDGMPDALESVMDAAEGRCQDTHATRAIGLEALILEKLTGVHAHDCGDGRMFYASQDVVDQLDRQQTTVAIIGAMKRLGLTHSRRRLPGSDNARSGFTLDGSTEERATFARYGVPHPFDNAPGEKKEGPL